MTESTAPVTVRPARRRANPTAAETALARGRMRSAPRTKLPPSRDARGVRRTTSSAARGRRIRVEWKDDAATASAELDSASRFVSSTSTPTLVLVHSPGCGFCVALREAFEATTAEVLKRGSNVVEIDARSLPYGQNASLARSIGESFWGGVPHILRLVPGSKSPKVYNGNRSSSSMSQFTLVG